MVDFYEVAESDKGYTQILTVIDLLSRWVRFIPQRSRTADETCQSLLEKLIYVSGVPLRFRSDENKAFLSHVMRGLELTLGIKHVTTKGHNARGNVHHRSRARLPRKGSENTFP